MFTKQKNEGRMSQLIDVKGIGPKVIKKLNNQGIQTIQDLLFYFPMKYETRSIDLFEDIIINEECTLEVTIKNQPKLYFIRKSLDKLSMEVETNRILFQVHIFNRRFLMSALTPGTEIIITGKFLKNLSSFTASSIILKKNYKAGILPVYGIDDVKEANMRKIISEVLSTNITLKETLPERLLLKHQIPNINDLIYKIHQPKQEQDIYESKKRIVYEELLEFALRMESLKKLNQTIVTKEKQYDIELVRSFISTLPFTLTGDQQLATNEIFRDLKKPNQMNRLLQGDVGSGKTIISIIASLAVVTANFQVAVMAPTLVLAKQHYNTFKKYLDPYNIQIRLLTSDLSNKTKKQINEEIKNDTVDIIIGTQSLIQEKIDFHNLGFVVIDEQHRFGVNQRKELRLKGSVPDVLLMSATPIPRTLAISLYKDIDISFIKEKPLGRKDIITYIIEYEELDSLLLQVTKELDMGHQAYFICPKILDSETSIKISVEELNELLQKKLGHLYQIDVLHGKMSDEEKEIVLDRFYRNTTKILISTTVVEVGVDVKNATVMIVVNANSFGLAQLHQLRGRIGRDEHQSYCYLVVDNLLESSDRLQVLKDTNDGFLISEYDLSIRGPGEVFGNIQSGIPAFKMANLINDQEILEEAFVEALEIIGSPDSLSRKLMNKALKLIESYNLD